MLVLGSGPGTGFAPSLGDSFDLIVADSIVGSFANIHTPILGGGLFFSHGIFDFGDGRDVFRLTVAEVTVDVPEPAPWLLLVSGLAMLRQRQTRRKETVAPRIRQQN